MTDPRNGGSGWPPPPVPQGQWPPPPPQSQPPPAPPTHHFTPPPAFPEWATTPQFEGQPTAAQPRLAQEPYAPQPYTPYGQQPFGGDSGAPWWAGQPGQPEHGGPRRKKSNTRRYGILAAIVIAALVGGGLYFFFRGEDITYQGRDIVEPEKVLADAESRLNGIVDERHGATNDETSCYFVAKNAETTDIEDRVVCGPVLFVDGDENEPYLTFPLTVSSGDADARVTVAAEPDSPDPSALANPDLLRRPDGAAPPAGSGGLSVPDPPRAAEGAFTEVPYESIELDSTPATARIGSPTMSIGVPLVGQPARYGRGDDARRPAKGEMFVGFELVSGPGETGPVGGFSIAVQVGEDDPLPLPAEVDVSAEPVQLVISVPEDSDEVTLVVTEGALVQKLSLTTGEPDPGNVAVWQRTNRTQAVGFSQGITIRASQPGFVTEDFPSTLQVNEVVLTYFAGPNLDRAPSAPDRAFLILDAGLNIDGQTDLGLDPPYWTLTLPDGTLLLAGDLHDDPTRISIAFDVPADFTTGTLSFGGALTTGGLTLDTLGVILQIPVAIPEG
ncbi:MAG: hypothetical protein M3400_03950 [Actinomycetota bacterium]|nr:hypothetical protein [Actinomycetota bacterium]